MASALPGFVFFNIALMLSYMYSKNVYINMVQILFDQTHDLICQVNLRHRVLLPALEMELKSSLDSQM
jgi:hypothetical protein